MVRGNLAKLDRLKIVNILTVEVRHVEIKHE